MLAVIQHEGFLVVARPFGIALRDPDDVLFLEIAVEGRADASATGNERHFASAEENPAVDSELHGVRFPMDPAGILILIGETDRRPAQRA